MNDNNINKVIYSFLFQRELNVSLLTEEEERLISNFSSKYLLSGYILESVNFDKNNKALKKELIWEKRTSLIKQLQTKQDLNIILKTLDSNKLNVILLKGSALNYAGISNPNIRYSKDIDLLLNKKDIPAAYQILKDLGFKYLDRHVSDRADIFYKHQMPVLANENGTLIEIHWRLTKPTLFEDCILSGDFFKNKKKIRNFNYCFMPSIDMLFLHLIYHEKFHHKYYRGPIFFFDLKDLLVFNENVIPDLNTKYNEIISKEEFNALCDLILKCTSTDNRNTKERNKLINQLENSIFNKEENLSFKELSHLNLLSKIKEKYLYNGSKYQLKKTDVKFWPYLVKDLISSLSKLEP